MKSVLKDWFLGGCLVVVMGAGSAAAELPLIIAHRGASAAAPENTLAAFRLAWKEGADGIEGDFFLSSDGEVVCIHDRDTKKTSNGNLDVRHSTLEALRAMEREVDFLITDRPAGLRRELHAAVAR